MLKNEKSHSSSKMAGIAERHKLHDLCHNGKLRQVKDYLASDPNAVTSINEQAGVFGYTPMHEAVSGKSDHILQVLLTYGGNVNALSNGKYTPLHIAASIGCVECIKVLLEYNANISLVDEFGKTPFATAQLNKRKRAARVLKTGEIKMMASTEDPRLGKSIESLNCGQDVEQNCFEEALEIAVAKNNHKSVGYLVIHGAKNVEECLCAALQKPSLLQTAALLLLCYAARDGDKKLIKHICGGLKTANFTDDSVDGMSETEVVLTRKFLPESWNKKLTRRKLWEIRKAASSVDMAFPVSIALNNKFDEAAKIIVFEKYCDHRQGEADWHGLALSIIQQSWVEEIRNYKKLVLSHNILHVVPSNIVKMQNLLRLDLSKNYILEVPREIFELPLLRNLNLSYNDITMLPKVQEWNKSMKILNLQANSLRTVDESIEKSELEDLNLSDNNLMLIPECICNVKSLTTLDISRNRQITVFPPELAKLTKLSFFGMRNMDQVTDPPPNLRESTTGLLRHLKAKLRNSEAYYTMKLMLVGRANRGKTTLMHRLDKDFAFNQNQSTKGVDIREITISRNRAFVFKFWDFAGQEEYYATHQCFLSQRSMYLLVWKVTDREKGIAGLKPWLDNLETRVPNSTVIIVGTHLDQVSEEDKANGFEAEMNGKIYELLSSYKKIKKPRPPDIQILMVTCNPAVKDCKERIEKLRQLIYSVAENMTVTGAPNETKIMGEKIPSSYLSLARMIAKYQFEMQEQNKIPILRKSQFEALVKENAKKNPRDIFDPDDVDNATRFLHDIGTILHYDDPNQDLRDLYFINPSWLCELMAKVVTVKAAHNFIKDGILHQKHIEFIIGRDRDKFPKEFFSQYLRLLYRFQIACRIDEDRVLIPSQLPEDFPSQEAKAIEPAHVLQRQHSFSCIPQGFWSRFIGRFLLYLKDMLTINMELKLDANKQLDCGLDALRNTLPRKSGNENATPSSVRNHGISTVKCEISDYTDQDTDEAPKSPLANWELLKDFSGSEEEMLQSPKAEDQSNIIVQSAGNSSDVNVDYGLNGQLDDAVNGRKDAEACTEASNTLDLQEEGQNDELCAKQLPDEHTKSSIDDENVNDRSAKSQQQQEDTSTFTGLQGKTLDVSNDLVHCKDSFVEIETNEGEYTKKIMNGVGSNTDGHKAETNGKAENGLDNEDVGSDTPSNLVMNEGMNDRKKDHMKARTNDRDNNVEDVEKGEPEGKLNVQKDTNGSGSFKSHNENEAPATTVDSDGDCKEAISDDSKSRYEGTNQNVTREKMPMELPDCTVRIDKATKTTVPIEIDSEAITTRAAVRVKEGVVLNGPLPFMLNNVVIDAKSPRSLASSTSTEDDYSFHNSREATPLSVDETFSSPSSECSTPFSSRPCSSAKEDPSPSIKVKNKPQRIVENITLSDMHCYEESGDVNDVEEEEFSEPADISYLLGRKYLRCWRKGIIFSHPKLFLSVGAAPSSGDRQLIETRVSRNLLGYRALSFIVDHIRTLIKEWYPGLSGDNGLVPYVRQLVSCPVCRDFNFEPPHMFDISDCYQNSITQDYILCPKNHMPKTINLRELCPDIMFMDLPSCLQLNPQDLTYLEAEDHLLGSGQFGKVYRGMYRDKQAAIKLSILPGGDDGNARGALDNFYDVRQEVIILSKVKKHPYIISFLGVAVRPKLCSVMELAIEGTLRKALKGQMGHIERVIIYRIAQQMASALSYLHQLGIVHRDLKSDNVLVFSTDPTSELNAKLTDFGTADFMSCTGLKFYTGTPGFRAPEILEYTSEYTAKVDVYSFAMVLYESITKRRPFQDVTEGVLEISRLVKEGRRPSFGDLRASQFGYLTLTQLMQRAWHQEAMKRPSSYDILQQMKSPSFCLLYAKMQLGKTQSPRQLCFVAESTELWVCCDDKSGASILVLDIISGKEKTKFTPMLSKSKDSFFNVVSIHLIDKNHVAVVLRSTYDYVIVYSTHKKKCVESYQVRDNYIKSLAVSECYVILGCEDGTFLRVTKKDFIKGKYKDKNILVNEKRSISALITNEQKLFVGCDKYIYKYPLDYKQQEVQSVDKSGHHTLPAEGMSPGTEQQHVETMAVSPDGLMLFISFRGSPIITCRLVETMDSLGDVDCTDVIKILLPVSDVYDQRVTCFCAQFDTLWVGTGSGHVLIYEVKVGQAPSFITWLRPYNLEVRCMMSCNSVGPESESFVVTIGKELNPNGLSHHMQGLCQLNMSFPVDQSPLIRKRSRAQREARRVVRDESKSQTKNVLLMWEAAGADTLRKISSLL